MCALGDGKAKLRGACVVQSKYVCVAGGGGCDALNRMNLGDKGHLVKQ